jgi:hypothetical protein
VERVAPEVEGGDAHTLSVEASYSFAGHPRGIRFVPAAGTRASMFTSGFPAVHLSAVFRSAAASTVRSETSRQGGRSKR